MSLFSKKKDVAVTNFVLKLINNNCPRLATILEDLRGDSRVNLVVVVMVIPLENGRLQVPQAFTAVTKEFSNTGVAVVLDQPHRMHQAVLGFRFEGTMTFIRAEAKHTDPMGGGFCQIGFHLIEIVSPADYPELKSLTL
jgi:hypothetical protein